MPDYNLKDWQAVERAERNVTLWLGKRKRSEIRGHFFAATMLFPLSLVAAVGVSVGLALFGGVIVPFVITFPVAAIAVLVGYPAQYVRWRRGLTRVSLRGGGVEVETPAEPTTFVLRTEDVKDFDGFDALCFPATIAGMGLQHLAATIQLSRADDSLMAKVLTALAYRDKRTRLHDLEMIVPDAGLPEALRALRHWPGVVWHVRDQVALAVNDELRNEIARQGGWRT